MSDLTPRQTEILRLLAKGLTNDAVGASLGISPSTVRSSLEVVYERLNIRSRAEAAVYAAQHGLLEVEEEARP